MKFLKLMHLSKKILYLLIFVAFAILFHGYNTNFKVNDAINRYLYKLPGGIIVETSLMNIFNSLDVRKIAKTTNDRDVIDLKFSADDIKELDNAYKCSGSFLLDRCKSWRKVKLENGNFQAEIKAKISGTSTTPYKRSHGVYDFLYRMFINKTAIHDVSKGGSSYVLKFGNEKFFNNFKRVSLISPFDDWSYFQNILNEYASKKGLITTFGRPYLLKINGIDSGVYLAQEKIGKELLERNYGITDYAILKPSDDWDSIPFGHQNYTDYLPEDKEQSGSSLTTIRIAQNRLRGMLAALELEDYESLSSYFDLGYMAKVSAMQLIYGTAHSSIGDNRRYIYNIANGYFYPTFRMEGNPVKLNVIDGVTPTLSDSFEEDKILKLLEVDNNFRSIRDMYLAEFISEFEEVKNNYNLFLDKYEYLISSTNRSNGRLSIKNDKGLWTYHQNVEILKNYINYNKIYTTEIKNISGECRYSIYVDSYSEIYLVYSEPNDRTQNRSVKLNRGINKIEFDGGICLEGLQFENASSGNKVAEDHVYFNVELDLPEFADFTKYFNYTDDGDVIRILRGRYYVTENVKFPQNRGVIIEPDVRISIADEKSILFFNQFQAAGTSAERIAFMPSENAFGSILIRANGKDVDLSFVDVYGGNEAYVEGVYASGQIVIINSNVDIKNSSFQSSSSDDGINIKFSTVNIESNTFSDNFGDQIDCDYCSGIITNNTFNVDEKLRMRSETDGLDVSGSNLLIENNYFSGFSDKALSIGEQSKVVVVGNFVEESNIGAAVKDGSYACFSRNKFQSNTTDITSYIKKRMYAHPEIALASDQIVNNNQFYLLKDNCDDIR